MWKTKLPVPVKMTKNNMKGMGTLETLSMMHNINWVTAKEDIIKLHHQRPPRQQLVKNWHQEERRTKWTTMLLQRVVVSQLQCPHVRPTVGRTPAPLEEAIPKAAAAAITGIPAKLYVGSCSPFGNTRALLVLYALFGKAWER